MAEIKRADPEGRWPVDAKAGAALRRFTDREENGKHIPAEDLATAEFRETGLAAEKLRTKIAQLLDIGQSRRSPEQIQLVNKLNGQYAQVRGVWTEKFPVDPERLASREEVGDWLETLCGQTLDGIGKFKNTSRLVMRPAGVTDPELIELINNNKMIPGQRTSEIYWPEGWDKVALAQSCFGITDGREDIPFDPNIYYNNPVEEKDPRINEEQVAAYGAQFNTQGLSNMPQRGYTPSMMTALSQGKVLDRKFWTAFPRATGTSLLPDANWYDDRVRLSSGNPDSAYNFLRCRPWVEGRGS